MTDEKRKALIAALIREREGYSRAGNKDRVKAVEEELRRLGAEGASPQKRATKVKGRKGTQL